MTKLSGHIIKILDTPNELRFINGTEPDNINNLFINDVYWMYYLTDEDLYEYNTNSFTSYCTLRSDVFILHRNNKIKKILI